MRVLIIADFEEDARRILLSLLGEDKQRVVKCVSTPEELGNALSKGQWDLVLAHSAATGLTPSAALSLIEELQFELPFVRSPAHLDQGVAEATTRASGLTGAQHRRLQEQLRKSEEKYRQLVNRAPIGIFRTSIDGRIIEANTAMLEVSGYDSTEALDRAGLASIYADPSDRGRLLVMISQGPVSDFRTTFRRLDGKIVPVSLHAQLVHDEQGNPQFLEGTIEDITERAEAEAALRASERRLRSLLDSISDWVWEVDTDAVYTYASSRVHDLLGYEPEEVVGKTPFDFMPPEEAKRIEALFRSVQRAREPFGGLENIAIHKDGRQVILETSGVPLLDDDGNLLCYRGVDRDITERKAAELALLESQDMLQLVLDTIPVRVFWKDRDSVYLGCNQKFAEDAALSSPEEIVGKTDFDLVWRRDETEFYRECDRRVMESDTPEYHIIEPQLRRDDSQAWVDTNKIPLHDPDGHVVGILGTYEDITERKRVEVELAKRNVELMAANEELERLHQVKDEFIAMVSHEFRTPLVTGMGYMEMLLAGRLGSLSDNAHDKMTIALRNLRRLSRLIDDILNFHRLSREEIQYEPQIAPVRLTTLFEECVEDFAVSSRRTPSRVKIEIAPQIPSILADQDMIRRIIANLLDNAERHAGEYAIVTLRARLVAGDRVRISVEDDGVGMPPEVRQTAFDPFVTSTSLTRGTGLGLAIVRAILDAHGSKAVLESEEGRGTTVWFELPTVSGEM